MARWNTITTTRKKLDSDGEEAGAYFGERAAFVAMRNDGRTGWSKEYDPMSALIARLGIEDSVPLWTAGEQSLASVQATFANEVKPFMEAYYSRAGWTDMRLASSHSSTAVLSAIKSFNAVTHRSHQELSARNPILSRIWSALGQIGPRTARHEAGTGHPPGPCVELAAMQEDKADLQSG